MTKKRSETNSPRIDKSRVLEALAKSPNSTKRDIARYLGVKGSDRIELKKILKDLEREGELKRGPRKTFETPGTLPDVTVLEITGQDNDGELIARPARWDSDKPIPNILVVPGRGDESGGALGAGERILARLSETQSGYEAKIIKRLGASVHKVLGVYREGERGGRVVPIDRKTKHEYIIDLKDRGGAAPNELVLCEPLTGRAQGTLRARIVERLGSMNEPKSVSLIAIHAHGIPTEFPQTVLDEAEAAKPIDPRGRTDLRQYALVTIDPEDARDHDDAVWAGPDPDHKGGHIVIVAIADVAHYVMPGSALDREAYNRGNSAYFPDRVVPMLPEKLSADLCSLMEGVDRPCLAVRMHFDSEGNKRRHEFVRGIMRSPASLTYRQAQDAFDGKDRSELARTVLMPLWQAYQTMAKARARRDPLDLDLPERRIRIGANGKIESIAFRERLESMRLIEEMMVMANVAAAETLEKARQPLIFRIHEAPSKDKLFSFADYLRSLNISFAKGQVIKPGAFNRILAQAKDTPNVETLNDVVLRTQMQAIYSPNNIGHFGLHLTHYAHFTSPIRRYADLLVHRALIRALHLGEGGLTEKEAHRLGEISEHISMTERRAMAAERDSTDRYVAAYMEDRVGATFTVRVTGVTRFGLFVRIPENGAEGLIPARSLGFEYFRHDERKHALIGERSGTTYKMGDRIVVRLAEAAPLTGGLRFELAEANAAPKRAPGAKPKFQARNTRRKRR